MDVAFSLDKSGRLTLSRDASGSPYLDTRAVYSVIATLAAHKGGYGWDGSVGTVLHKLRKDGRLTGTRLSSVGADLGDQLRGDEIVRSLSASPERLRSGAWGVTLAWTTTVGTVVEKVTV